MNTKDIQTLINTAIDMMHKAHAPYSKFHVGAALQISTGEIIGGCNIESASYGLTICAERVAIFQAIAQGYQNITHLALVTETGSFPCGACRQIINEFAPQATIIIATPIKILHTTTCDELLPNGFGNNDLHAMTKGVTYEQL